MKIENIDLVRELVNERHNYMTLSKKLSEEKDHGAITITYGGFTFKIQDSEFRNELSGLVSDKIKNLDQTLEVL